ncbi:uncharacterized protein LOC110446224 [Mizuhopecten yessoensis]|uniref:uncharacterized protein LOC110446224 n=1 Tax=Mizuhopecten yessoensis TaxID=6573 RepID=UPI000B45BF15|nr:uncharacterized protein LOC110446224 [Mizuhopecten yessoensis]
MHKLFKLGVRGKILTLINIMPHGTRARWLPVKYGIRQGSVICNFLYFVFINDLLLELEHRRVGAKIYDINCSNPALADDIAFIATSPSAFQTLLDICTKYAKTWKFTYNADKSTVLVFGNKHKRNNDFKWSIMEHNLQTSDSYKHVGVNISTDLKKIDKRKLNFLSTLIHLKSETLSKQIFLRRLYQYIQDPYNLQYENFLRTLLGKHVPGEKLESKEEYQEFLLDSAKFIRSAAHVFLSNDNPP